MLLRRQWIASSLLAAAPIAAAGVIVAASGGLAGCHKTFRGAATQPNPLTDTVETLRSSEKIIIITGDMELNLPYAVGRTNNGGLQVNRRYPLHNEASFTVVSRDRLRFHVQLEHKWKEWADLHTWDAYLIDDQGRRYRPEQLERAKAQHLVSMWDYETRSVVRNIFGDIVYIRDDGYKRRQALGTLSVFRGEGDFVFYARNIFTPDVKRLTLVLDRTGLSFSFTWQFADDYADDDPPSELATLRAAERTWGVARVSSRE